jgi:hypothetical protein
MLPDPVAAVACPHQIRPCVGRCLPLVTGSGPFVHSFLEPCCGSNSSRRKVPMKQGRWKSVLLAAGLAGALPATAGPVDASTPGPVAKAVGDVVSRADEPAIEGFRWGSPVAELAASDKVQPNAGLSERCANDIGSAERRDCVAFVPTDGDGFARAFYATRRDGLLMVESRATQFDCEHFDDMASPQAGHRAELARMGWTYLRRDQRPEGGDAIVETQWYVRHGVGVELTFVKAPSVGVCGVKSFVTKML